MPKHPDHETIPSESLEVLEAVLLETPRRSRSSWRRRLTSRWTRGGCPASNAWLLVKSTLLLPRAHRVRVEAMVHPESVQDLRCSRWLGLEVAVVGVRGLGCYVVALGSAAQDYTARVSLRISNRCLAPEPSRPLPLSVPLPLE